MPEITSYTPAWLSKPNVGHGIFTAAQGASTGSSSRKEPRHGPRRTIARRGTEVFIAVGKEIRWADLVYLKETWEEEHQRRGAFLRGGKGSNDEETEFARGYRTIVTKFADEIKQLVISPNSNYMAILTDYTVHIMILPEVSHLTAPDVGPLKAKIFQLGPTVHVTSRSSVASALWHPLGVSGSCLVTVTEDALVRVWELSPSDRNSFDRPTLAIDLKKLADGTSADGDFEASTWKNNKFSPDAYDMEVASACFAGRGAAGWAPMTLWVAMTEGDVYALCPLLPEKWSPPPTLIPSLSISIVARIAAMEDDLAISVEDKLLGQQQLQWMTDLDNQEPVQSEGSPGEPLTEVFSRPLKPGKIPKLQGPFDIDFSAADEDEDDLLTDIFVIGPKIDAEELMDGEEDELEMDEADREGLSMGVVCLLKSSGRLAICLDLDGVGAQWLPRKTRKMHQFSDDPNPPSLLTFQAFETSPASEVWEGSWPMFSPDVNSRYSFFITSNSRITFMSLAPWVFRLETELQQGSHGIEFRADLLINGQNTIRQRIMLQTPSEPADPFAACNAFRDPDLGYFLLTYNSRGPSTVKFSDPDHDQDLDFDDRSSIYDESEADKPIQLIESREVYKVADEFSRPSALPSFQENMRHSKYKRLLKDQIRLSPAMLSIMTDAHVIVSQETHDLNRAVSELFRRCEQLQIELVSHIQKANDVASRIDDITGNNDDEPGPGMDTKIQERIKVAKVRQQSLADRVESMRKKISKGTQKELSDKEVAWNEEVNILQQKVLGEGADDFASSTSSFEVLNKEPWQRYEEVKELKQGLLEEVEILLEDQAGKADTEGMKVPSEVRKRKMAQVEALLERESALVESARERLEKQLAKLSLV